GALLGLTEDQLAYLRDPHQFRNALIHELPNGDFAFSISRLVLVSAFSDLFWRSATASSDAVLAAIAAKAEKETAYHLRHSAVWLVRLGDGTPESHRRAQDAIDALWPYTGELFEVDETMVAAGVLPDPLPLRAAWDNTVGETLASATLTRPADGWMQSGGRQGRHTEHLGLLLAEMQVLPLTHPGATLELPNHRYLPHTLNMTPDTAPVQSPPINPNSKSRT